VPVCAAGLVVAVPNLGTYCDPGFALSGQSLLAGGEQVLVAIHLSVVDPDPNNHPNIHRFV
jgi:hypothetical protein